MYIAHGMFLPGLMEDSLREAIATYAGEIELLEERSPRALQNWLEIRTLVLELAARAKADH